MPHSESDDFESADEGQSNYAKKGRKKRNSSSNYSENLDSDISKPLPTDGKDSKQVEVTEGWDDFEIDKSEVMLSNDNETKQSGVTTEKLKKDAKSEGWDDFGEWEETDISQSETKPLSVPDKDVKVVTERIASVNTKTDSWGWGWGVDSLLSTATAGITTLTTQVSQGISTVLETGIGAPDPEELARVTAKERETQINKSEPETRGGQVESPVSNATGNEMAFPFGSILSGVSKFVETTGTKVIAGGLDTLETIGKKTMEVLQDGDPGLAKKRAMLGLDAGDKPILSQILREAKEKADEEDQRKEAKREAKEVHYETLFDDFEGLIHLEALEMLSKQVSMRIEDRLKSADPAKRQDIKETLQQVAELCEMPDDEDSDDEEDPEGKCKEDVFHEKLQRATRDIGLKMQFQPLIKHYTEILACLSENEADVSEKVLYKRAVSGLAKATALALQLYHKTAEMLLVKPRRSTADEGDALTQLTVVLTKHISELATLFTERLHKVIPDDSQHINNYITNVFLEAGNSSKYIENAFQLALPIVQIGAV